MKELKNYADLLEQLTKILLNLEKDKNHYQTDIYLYYDEQEETGSLDTFTNPGGTSWINDDHYCIGIDPEHYDTMFDDYPNIGDLAGTIESCDVLHLAANKLDVSEDELTWHDVKEYIEADPDLVDEFYDVYSDMIDEEYTEGCRRRAEGMLVDWMILDEELEFLRR